MGYNLVSRLPIYWFMDVLPSYMRFILAVAFIMSLIVKNNSLANESLKQLYSTYEDIKRRISQTDVYADYLCSSDNE